MSYKYIFWDWNGTLFDDARPTCDAVNDMLDARGLPRITFEHYRDTVEVPIVKFYETVMDMSVESMEALSVEFDRLWASHLNECPLFNNAVRLLSRISDAGIKQYIYSSSRSEKIIPYLEEFGISGYFEKIVASDDCFVGSKAERTRDFILKNGIPPSEVLFIGDMDHDSEVASLVGSDCMLVACGHQSHKKLDSAGRRVLPSLESLETILSDEVIK